MEQASPPPSAGRPSTADRWLNLLLIAACGSFAYLAWPFVGTLLVAAMVVVVVWPIHATLLRLVRRPWLATALSLLVLTLGIGGVLGLGVGIVIPEIIRLAQDLGAAAEAGTLQQRLDGFDLPTANAWMSRLTGEPTDLGAELVGAVQSALAALAGAVAGALPALLQVTGLALLQIVIFLLSLGSFLLSGPEIVAWIRRLAPLETAYSDRLMGIFASFSRNVVAASLVGSFSQGLVAGLGYLIAGVEQAALFAVLSAAAAVVPLVGPVLIWLPVALLLFAQGRSGAGAFVIVWNIVLTGTVDNLVKPLVVRGRTDLAPLLVFLGVFGGLSTFGLVGILVGPMVVAVMMALFTILEERRAAQAENGAAPPPDAPSAG